MEGSGKGGSSSSISSQLFGTNKAANAANSSSKVFDSVFSSSSSSSSPTQPEKRTWYGRDPPRSQFGSWRAEPQVWTSSKQGSSGNTNLSKEGGEGHTKDSSSIFHDKTVEQPCYLSSSLYYGGQDMYSNPSNDRTSGTPHIFKKDGGSGEDDTNESNLNSASRGNWWQGSLYY